MNTKKNNPFYLGKEKRKMNSLLKKLGQEHIKCFECKKGKKLVLIVSFLEGDTCTMYKSSRLFI